MTAAPWTPDKMITAERVDSVARALFPDDIHSGDCMAERDREGQPCRVCAERNAQWDARKVQVRSALFVAFGYGGRQ